MSSGRRWSWSLALGLLSPVMALGQEQRYQQAPPDYVTPEAPKQFYRPDVKRISYDKFYEAYARFLKFDPVYGAADSQRVTFDSGGRIGSGGRAVIEPEEGAWALDSNQLANGRVIARIQTDQIVDSLGYGPGPTWTYWWVDKRGPKGTWRSLFFSSRLKEAKESNLTHHTYPYHRWRQSIARWRGSQWGSCDRVSCCIKE